MHTQIACLIILIPALAIALTLSGCGKGGEETGRSAFDDHHKGSMELKYADQFSVDYYDDGISVVRVEDGLDYLVTDGSGELPDWLSEEDIKGMTSVPAASPLLSQSQRQSSLS